MILASSTLQPPADYFTGYCFAGVDYISDNEGALEYERETGNALTPGHDGCYAIIRSTPHGLEIGTDGRGSMKLFLFRRGTSWAVSTSLTILVSHLRSRGFPIELRPAFLKAMSLPAGFTQQQITTRTAYVDIELIPSFEKLVVRRGVAQTVTSVEPARDMSYEDALGRHVRTWRGRIQTVMAQENTVLTTDLSGGRDSRVCFAFAEATGLLDTGLDRFRLASNTRWTNDFEAATTIASHYGYELNTSVRAPETSGSAERAVQRWRELSMGVYLPVYLNPAARDPRRIHLHGAGGGNFRPLYKVDTLTAKLDNLRKYFSVRDYADFRDIALEDMERLRQKRPGIPELSLHYREFRNRFHFGFAPQFSTILTPLNSILLDSVTDQDGISADDVYGDIMDALVPNLKTLPYDDPDKMPRRREPSDAARQLLNSDTPSGKAYIGKPATDGHGAGGRQFNAWLSNVASNLRELRPSEYLTAKNLSDALDFMEAAADMPRRPQANSPEMKLLSYASSVAFATAS